VPPHRRGVGLRPRLPVGAVRRELEPDAYATPGAMEAGSRSISAAGDSGKKTGVKVREYWSLPCRDYPKGAHVVYAPGTKTVLLAEDLPYPWLPYVMFRGLVRPGTFWPAGIDDLISPQTELNKSLSQIEENAERIGNPPLIEAVVGGLRDRRVGAGQLRRVRGHRHAERPARVHARAGDPRLRAVAARTGPRTVCARSATSTR
jgi:hypothetical protein